MVNLKCTQCSNEKEFLAHGIVTNSFIDEVWGDGNVEELGEVDGGDAIYTSVECSECGAETKDVKGAEEWIDLQNRNQ